MDGFPPTADEAQALHFFFYGRENQRREGEIGEARKTHNRDKRKG
jgi:hypothetical protein